MITVLHVLEAIEGGTARHLVDVVRHVEDVRHVVVIPSERTAGITDTKAAGAMRAADADVRIVAMTRAPLTPANARALVALRRLVRDLRPDVVHGHSSIGGALARAAAARLAPCVYTPNGIAPGPPSLVVERALGRCTTRLVAVSPSEADLARRRRLVARDRIGVIPNGIEQGVPADPIDVRALLGLAPGVRLVGTISRLVHQKAPVDVVRMTVLLPDAHVVVIGDGPLRAQVEDEVRSAGVGDRFHLIPALPGAAAALGSLDVFVLASRFEGAPYAPLEAMRAGVPVVLTDVTGNRDVVTPESGFLVPPGDPAALADAVRCLLTDDDRRTAMGAAAATVVAQRHDVRAMAAALAALYRSLA